ncbi:MAG TPA: glucuronate isomerase [Jiangellaceae bacterium]|nr:glucuronate isomerase [Jiangellaceae bacterium]
MADVAGWTLHPDRALPSEPGVRAIAREIYDQVRDLPLVAMHGHVEAEVLDRNQSFGDPAELLVIPDHYLVRMLVSQGVPISDLGVPTRTGADAQITVETDHREVWRRFCSGWHLFRGTPTRYWLEHELVEVFGIAQQPSAENADALYDELSEKLAGSEFHPRALFERFDIEILATTDSALSQLDHHASLAKLGWGKRVVPTFRPDPLLHLDRAGWPADVRVLSDRSGVDVTTYADYVTALEQRRSAFATAGARATDHGHLSADTTPLADDDAERIFAAALRGDVPPDAAAAFAGHMLFEMARMSVDDGLVMQLHPGVLRDHHGGIHSVFGPDKGYDIPVRAEYTRSLRPLLEAFGNDPALRLIVFTTDETVYSRELAPLAGVYPAMKLGAPWWFLDSPDGMRRFRELVTETAGFYNTTGFVDDTRAFASIPARHDLSRRIDAGYLARLVAEHRIGADEAAETAIDLAYRIPLAAYAPRDRVGPSWRDQVTA